MCHVEFQVRHLMHMYIARIVSVKYGILRSILHSHKNSNYTQNIKSVFFWVENYIYAIAYTARVNVSSITHSSIAMRAMCVACYGVVWICLLLAALV